MTFRVSSPTVTRGRYRGQTSKTIFNATLVGGPELAKALDELDEKVRVRVARDVVEAMGRVILPAWAGRVPVKDGNYRDSLEVVSRKAKRGATGYVRPGLVAGLPDDEQPRLYAGKLEFGYMAGASGQKGSGHFVPSQPSARPAFDSTRDAAVAAGAEVIRRAAEGVHAPAPAMPRGAAPAVHVPYRGLPRMAPA